MTAPSKLKAEGAADAPDDWRKAYDVLGEVMTTLEPLSPCERARVLLVVILRFAPHAFSDAELMDLVRQGKEPQP